MKKVSSFSFCCLIVMMRLGLYAQVFTVTLQPGPGEGKDALIRDDAPGVNFGDDVNITSNAWTVGGNPCILRSMIRFDLASIPADAQVLNATLSLYCNDNSGIYQLQAGDNASYLLRVTDDWDEHTVNWVNQPGITMDHSILIPTSGNTYQDYPDIDVTLPVQDMVSSPAENYGWMIRLVTEELYRSMVFASSDHPLANWWPKLVITYKICDLPVARFVYQHDGPMVSFSDSSSSAATWFWDFGDGYFSSLQNPAHDYVIPGKYQVCLTIEDSCGTAEFCDTVMACDLPVASFSHSEAGLTGTFTHLTAGTEAWQWSFGDGFYSDLSDPVHVFNLPGTYHVCLTCLNECGGQTYCDSVKVSYGTSVTEEQPAAIIIHPNPAHGAVRISRSTGAVTQPLIYEIADPAGKRIISGMLIPGQSLIDLAGLPPGLYVIRIQTGGGRVTRKLVVF